jgi:hypothetical protein
MFVIVMSIVALGQLHSANAELQSSNRYIVFVKGHDLKNNLENTIELELLVGSGSSSKIPIYLVEGLIIHDNKDFITSKNWKGSILPNDGLMMISGSAMSYDGTTLSMELLGKLVNNTKQGATYRLVGSIIHDNQRVIIFTNVTEITDVHFLTKAVLKELPHITINQSNDLKKQAPIIKKSYPITVITKHFDRLYIQYPYSFTSKVYFLKENRYDDFDQKGGEVQGANVTVNIIDQNGEVIKSFNGTTDKFGYFSDSFLPPDDFAVGTYMVHVTAEKDGMSDTNDLALNVFKRPIGGTLELGETFGCGGVSTTFNAVNIRGFSYGVGSFFVQDSPVDIPNVQVKPRNNLIHISNNITGDAGIVLYFGGSLRLGDLQCVNVVNTGSPLALNLWLDTGNDGSFFSFLGTLLIGLDGDSYGSHGLNADELVNNSTSFYMMGGSGAGSTYTLEQLKQGQLSTVNANTHVALWIGSNAPFSSDISKIYVIHKH